MTTGLNQKLTQLKLSRMREVVDSLIAQAEQQQLGYAEFLDELLNEEVLGRQENQIRKMPIRKISADKRAVVGQRYQAMTTEGARIVTVLSVSCAA